MNGSIPVLLALHNVLFIVAYDNDGVIPTRLYLPRPTTARSCSTTFNQCLGENDNTWWYRTPSFLMTMQGATPQLLSWTFCAAGNGRFWNIHRTHPIHSSPEWKNHVSGTVQNKRWTYPCYRVVNMEPTKMDMLMVVQCLPNISQNVINEGAIILKVCKCCIPINKAMSEILNCCHYFLSNPCTLNRSHLLCICIRTK